MTTWTPVSPATGLWSQYVPTSPAISVLLTLEDGSGLLLLENGADRFLVENPMWGGLFESSQIWTIVA